MDTPIGAKVCVILQIDTEAERVATGVVERVYCTSRSKPTFVMVRAEGNLYTVPVKSVWAASNEARLREVVAYRLDLLRKMDEARELIYA